MAGSARIELRRLRQIGWDMWDPIGIRQFGTVDWQEGAADEYDHYLLHAADILRRGASVDEAASYLDRIAAEHMGLGAGGHEAHEASVRTARAISVYLNGLAASD